MDKFRYGRTTFGGSPHFRGMGGYLWRIDTVNETQSEAILHDAKRRRIERWCSILCASCSASEKFRENSVQDCPLEVLLQPSG